MNNYLYETLTLQGKVVLLIGSGGLLLSEMSRANIKDVIKVVCCNFTLYDALLYSQSI
jgi:hypothetical protein